MAVEFNRSNTKENLMKAFAGESQARNRYTIAADTCKKQSMYAVGEIFLFTAEQERAHAQRYYDLLKELSGNTIEISGGFPIDHHDDIVHITTRWKSTMMSIRHLVMRLRRKDFLRRRPHSTRLRRLSRFMRNGLRRLRRCWRVILILNGLRPGCGCA